MDEQPDPNEATPSAPVNVRIDARALIPDWQFLFLAFLLLASDGWSSSLWLKSGFLRAEIVEASIVFVRRMRACQWGRASGARSKKTSGLHTRSGYSSRASVLSAAERVAGGGGVRRVCRRVVQEVLCRQVWVAVGKKPEVTDAGEAFGKQMQQETRRNWSSDRVISFC